jgi:hypothetical protein
VLSGVPHVRIDEEYTLTAARRDARVVGGESRLASGRPALVTSSEAVF